MKVLLIPLTCETIQNVYDNYAAHPNDTMVALVLLGDKRIIKHLDRCQVCFNYGEQKAAEATAKKKL